MELLLLAPHSVAVLKAVRVTVASPASRVVRGADALLQLEHLDVVVHHYGSLIRQQLAEHPSAVVVERRGERNSELDDEVALVGGVAVVRHALRLDHLHVAVVDHLARQGGVEDLAVVERRDHAVEAAQRLHQVDLLLHDQIGALSGEAVVLLLVEHDDDVSRRQTRLLVSLQIKDDLLSVVHARLDLHLEDLLLVHLLLGIAALAAVLLRDHLALAHTRGAPTLHLGDHARSEPLHPDDDSVSVALAALLLGADRAAPTLARLAQAHARDLPLSGASLVELLERDAHLVHRRSDSPLPSAAAAPSASEEHAEDVHGVVEALATAAAALQKIASLLIIDRALLRVGEDLVGLGDVLELLGVVGVLVRVVFQREFPVRLLELAIGGRRRDLQQVVQVGLLDHPDEET
ncbi:hypothetical protein PENTCL1PPCAC_30504, partial [Pristionchus entomophagus]